MTDTYAIMHYAVPRTTVSHATGTLMTRNCPSVMAQIPSKMRPLKAQVGLLHQQYIVSLGGGDLQRPERILEDHFIAFVKQDRVWTRTSIALTHEPVKIAECDS